MKDIFGEIEPSMELELFDKLPDVLDFDLVLALFKSYCAEGLPVDEAFALASAEVIPENWSSFSMDQS